MPHISQLGSSKFISQADCMKPLLLTIKGCHQDEVGKDDGDKEERWCLDFEEIKKSLVLNQTNGELLGEITGKETIEEMVGFKVVLFVDPTVKFGKKKVGGVRVRAPKQPPNQPPQQTYRQPAPRPAPPVETWSDGSPVDQHGDSYQPGIDEDVPF